MKRTHLPPPPSMFRNNRNHEGDGLYRDTGQPSSLTRTTLVLPSERGSTIEDEAQDVSTLIPPSASRVLRGFGVGSAVGGGGGSGGNSGGSNGSINLSASGSSLYYQDHHHSSSERRCCGSTQFRSVSLENRHARDWWRYAHDPQKRRILMIGIGAMVMVVAFFVILSSSHHGQHVPVAGGGATVGVASMTDPTMDPFYRGPSDKKQMITMAGFNNNLTEYRVYELTKTQIERYRAGTALLLAIHVMRSAGGDFCRTFGKAPGTTGTPNLCHLNDKSQAKYSFPLTPDFPHEDPWFYNQTSRSIALVRPHFHLIQWTYGIRQPEPALRSTNFEHPDLLSVMIMRDPIARLLSGDGWVVTHHRNIYLNNATLEEWWDFANTTHGNTDNFFLRLLAGKPCCNGKDTDPKYLDYAKALLIRFSIVLDMACLDEGIDAVADLLGLDVTRRRNLHEKYADEKEEAKEYQRRHLHTTQRERHHPPDEQRIPFPEVYQFLLARNHLDIELYEWSKSISLVNCATLPTPAPTGDYTAPPSIPRGVGPIENDDDEDNRTPETGTDAGSDQTDGSDAAAPVDLDEASATDGEARDIDGPTVEDEPDHDAPRIVLTLPPTGPGPQPTPAPRDLTPAPSDIVKVVAGGAEFFVSQIAQEQIDRYRHDKGTIVNIHITHHGGTAFCRVIGHAPPTSRGYPSFNCMFRKDEKELVGSGVSDNPWTFEDTAMNVNLVTQAYHMTAWEFKAPPGVPLADTDWANRGIVSVIVMRHPISRLLAGDGVVNRDYPGVHDGTATEEVWWNFANSKFTDNYALRVLAGRECCDGANTGVEHLENAKKLLSRFTFILDIECLLEGMEALADILGIDLNPGDVQRSQPKPHTSMNASIPFDGVREFLWQRNARDIELYEWSKTRSLIDCSAAVNSAPDEHANEGARR